MLAPRALRLLLALSLGTTAHAAAPKTGEVPLLQTGLGGLSGASAGALPLTGPAGLDLGPALPSLQAPLLAIPGGPLLVPQGPAAQPEEPTPPLDARGQLDGIQARGEDLRARPAEDAKGAGGDGFDQAPPAGPPTVPEGPPGLEAASRGAQRYISSIMGGAVPDAKQRRGLADLYMEERGIMPESALGRALLARLFPAETAEALKATSGLDPPLQHIGLLLLDVARENRIPLKDLEALIKKRQMVSVLRSGLDRGQQRARLEGMLKQERIERTLQRYPAGPQGTAMRDLALQVVTSSGKSIEEITRDGAFLYVDFAGRSVRHVRAGRDPDDQRASMVLYVTFDDGKWDLQGYRQNRGLQNAGLPDREYVQALKRWLVAGGVPPGDLR